MRITIFSLGGLLGQYVTNTALLHGAQVTAYVPDAKAIWPRKNLTVIEGSLQNRERVLEALLEADAVISVLTPMRVKHVKEEETPLADGNAMILSAMKQLGKTRFVTVGHVCIHAFGDCEDKYQRMSTKFMQIFWPGVYKDMQKMGRWISRRSRRLTGALRKRKPPVRPFQQQIPSLLPLRPVPRRRNRKILPTHQKPSTVSRPAFSASARMPTVCFTTFSTRAIPLFFSPRTAFSRSRSALTASSEMPF